ncbi:MAG: hypothetical protein ACYS7M_10720 [Planctomycetota bacterium]|jgi:hypothetical protein
MNDSDGCHNCFYFDDGLGDNAGWCRRYPPRTRVCTDVPDDPNAAVDWEWPVVYGDQFCGEWWAGMDEKPAEDET